jgi:hypothetical protein
MFHLEATGRVSEDDLFITYLGLLTELSPSWEAANCAATQEDLFITLPFTFVVPRQQGSEIYVKENNNNFDSL